jgi:phage shock protein PspC (stress-responsive transcriptional regulator)
MQKVITVNLNGNAYQLEETAYAALRAYLDRAELQLKDNPDKAEIIADLEQAIGDKCRRFLGPHKTVMATSEIEQIVAEMGPVEGSAEPVAGATAPDPDSSSSSKTKSDTDAPKRLYRVVDGSMISGVCAGLAAYTHINVTVIRLVFFILFFGTGGAFALVYLGLMFILPPATTSEEHAAAYGMPFNAQELVDQAKQYSEQFKKGAQQFKEGAFTNSWEWRRQWRQQRRDFRRHMRQQRWMWRSRAWAWPGRAGYGSAPAAAPPPAAPPPQYQPGYGAQVAAGITLPILALLNAALVFGVLAVMFSILTTGTVFGIMLPENIPSPLAIVAVVAVFAVVASPLRLLRRASYQTLAGAHYGPVGAWDSMMGLGLTILFCYLAYHYIPEVREFVQNLPAMIDSLIHEVQ